MYDLCTSRKGFLTSALVIVVNPSHASVHIQSSPSSQKLIPIPGFLPPGYSSFSCVAFVFSSTWGDPEVGCGDNLFRFLFFRAPL